MMIAGDVVLDGRNVTGAEAGRACLAGAGICGMLGASWYGTV